MSRITRYGCTPWLGLLLGGSAALAAAASTPTTTIDAITRHNGLSDNGRFVIKTPSILRPLPMQPVPANPKAAIAQYDHIVALPADPGLRAEALRRSADLRMQLAEVDGLVNQPVLGQAIALYQTLLSEQPDYALNDRVLYQLARAQQALGNTELAIDTLRTLSTRYPGSARTPDSAFRAAELLYQRGRFAEAEPLYRIVLTQGADTSLLRPAQYKLAWALVKQDKHAAALPVLFAILDRELPASGLEQLDTALASLPVDRREMASEALRVLGLTFAALGPESINAYLAQSGPEPRFAPLLYTSLAAFLLDQQRYTEAARVALAFVEQHPSHPQAPAFHAQAIAAYQQGGFSELLLAAKADYVQRYAPGAPYWGGLPPSATVLATVRKTLDELGSHYQAQAQRRPPAEVAARQSDFQQAAHWYQQTLQRFPQDPNRAKTNLHLADALLDAGQVVDAMRQYERTAYDYPSHPAAPEAAYAAVQASARWQQEAGDATTRRAAQRESVRLSLRLAEQFPAHAQWDIALAQAARNLMALEQHADALEVASRLLVPSRPVSAALRREMAGVVADARFGQKEYAEAEAAYASLLKLLAVDDPLRAAARERLALSAYRQGEAARADGDWRLAATHFRRVGERVPEASLRAEADYDAAAALISLKDWPNAARVLSGFLARFAGHRLAADAEKSLAQVYVSSGQAGAAAGIYARLATREGTPAEVQREAAWQAAQLSDQASDVAASLRHYQQYVAAHPQPLQRALTARRRLADLSRSSARDEARYLYWLRDLIAAEELAGSTQRSAATRQMSAQAYLEIGQLNAAHARSLKLRLPLEQSLAWRRDAIEAAVSALDRAAAAGFDTITTAATYELGAVYRDFSRALLDSEPPGALQGDALAQYRLLLEEQAEPFVSKAMQAHEANLNRLQQGVWDDSIRRSSRALAELAPARYGKREQREERYEPIH